MNASDDTLFRGRAQRKEELRRTRDQEERQVLGHNEQQLEQLEEKTRLLKGVGVLLLNSKYNYSNDND